MNIFVRQGIVPVHSLDLWGPIVDAGKLGAIKIDAYREVRAGQGVSDQDAAKAIADYQGLLDGKDWATGKRKRSIIKGVEKVLEDASVSIGYGQALQEDGVHVIREALDNGHGVIVFTSKAAEALRKGLPGDLGTRLGTIYDGGKTDPMEFRRVYETEQAMGRHVVSHTADELPELEAAVASGLFQPQGLIYVRRNDSKSRDEVLTAGVGQFVDDLRDVGYVDMVAEQP